MNNVLQYIPQISKDIIWRYEPKIKDGTLFIYHIDRKSILEGNSAMFTIIKHIDGINSCNEVINIIANIYPNIPKEQIANSVVETIEYLKVQGVIN